MDDLVNAIRSPHKIVLMDACRNNPLIQQTLASKGRGLLSRGLAPPNITSGGIFIAYATASGDVATDGSSQNSPFAESLARHLENPESIDDMFSRVTKDVLKSTNKQQRPFKYASLEGRFCLPGPCDSLVAINNPSPTNNQPKPQADIKKDIPKEILKIRKDKLNFYTEWVTYNWTEEHIYQFQPSSFIYDPEKQIARISEKSIKNITGFASIFAVNGEYSITKNRYHCAQNTFTFEEISRFDSDGKLIEHFLIPEHDQKPMPIPSGSITEDAFYTFCSYEANVFNTVVSTNESGQKLYGASDGRKYYWDKKASMELDGKKYFSVVAMGNPVHVDEIDETYSTEIVVAIASCDSKSRAQQVNSFYINEQGKINRVLKWLPAIQHNLVENSPGFHILKDACNE